MLHKLLCLLGIGALSATTVQAEEFTFYQYSKSPEIIEGVQFPRNNVTLYRGYNSKKHLYADTASKAMLGPSDFVVESPYFRYVRKALTKKQWKWDKRAKRYYKKETWTPEVRNTTMTHPFEVYHLDRFSFNKVQEYQAMYNDHEPFTEDEAIQMAKNITTEYFENMGDRTVIHNLINYEGNWADWPWQVIFSTIDVATAAKYGEYVMGWKEEEPKSIDLGHWNYKTNGYWSSHKRDAGELTAPGYIPGNWVNSFEIREKLGVCVPKFFKHPREPFRMNCYFGKLMYGFYKSKIEGKDYVLVFSGIMQHSRPVSGGYSMYNDFNMDSFYMENVGYPYSDLHNDSRNLLGIDYAEAICKVSETDYRVCIPARYKKEKDMTKQENKNRVGQTPQITNRRPRLVGIVARCESAQTCELPSSINATFNYNPKRDVPSDLKKAVKWINRTSYNDGTQLFYFKVK